MHKPNPFKSRIARFLLVFSGLAALTAAAQPAAPVAGIPANPAVRTNAAPNRLLGSPQQRAMLGSSWTALQEEQRPLREKISEARTELHTAIYADTVDEALVRAKAEALAKLEIDLAVLQAQQFAKIRPTLSPAQLQQYKQRGMGAVDRLRNPISPAGITNSPDRRVLPPRNFRISTNSPARPAPQP